MSFPASNRSRVSSTALFAVLATLPAVSPVFASTPAGTTPAAPSATPATEAAAPITLAPFVVEAEAESDHTVQGPFLPDVQGTRINAGKKTTMLDFDALPAISGSNYRQALIQTPGLVLSEESTPLLSIGYRGLDPHRAQFTQVLKDGIPIHADQFGYPEAYYVPPLQTVDRIEFVHGGAALQYGPQPGGALNYVTLRPRTDKTLGGGTENTFGEDNTWNSFSHLDGTTGRVGYYFYNQHRETEGFRAANSDVALDAYNLTLALDASAASRWFLNVETYREEHGEPGGLTRADFAANPNKTTRRFDRFQLDRDALSLTWERDLTEGQFTLKTWAVDYTRASARQAGGSFGVAPASGASFANEVQTFRTYGADARYRRDWGELGRHVFSGGLQLYTTDSQRTDTTGATAFADTTLTRTAQRDVLYAPVFAENLFRFGKLSITPGVRVETFRQSVAVNPNSTAPDREQSDAVPLFGLGAAYDLPSKTQVYANLSESYRPVTFQEAVPTSGGTTVASDLAEGRAWQAEVGYRGEPAAGFVFDTSVFHMVFDDKIGTVGGVTGNIGRADYSGAEAAVQYDLLRQLEGARGLHQLNLLGNLTVLDAEIPSTGKTPSYAPDYIVRTGLIYSQTRRAKIAFLGTYVADGFADDDNTATRALPAYLVWDLTGEYTLAGTPFTLLAGVNNVFDEAYTSRIRGDGIDPAAGRNFYLGFRAAF